LGVLQDFYNTNASKLAKCNVN